ncbi:MAG: transporter ATP-binding protein [Clostridiales bacterium]|nr:transporter ATP-binding protein [Clostridiales bacterium]
MEAITVNNLSVAYEKNLVLDNMNLTIPTGKVSIIIGANGCGKSTLLKTIARILKPQKGKIYINGNDIKHQKPKKIATQVAVLPQGPKCPDGLSVRELIAYGRFPHQKTIGGLTSHDKDIINWAWIAMTLAQETEIILLDEPTTYLDMSYQLEILQLLQKMNRERGTTIVVVLHELNNSCRFADNIIGLKQGKIVCEGAPSV